VSNDKFIKFGEVARSKIGMQCQYACDYLDAAKHPTLAAGVRWKGDLADYHFVLIHEDDVEAFVERVQTWRRSKGII
jgi:hypothetical protein